ncbi:MAG: DUF1934 domain-containing protein [Clostridia bacterium]|nr:DUF1934 domain-containing protein [Clostridia bacterium]
MNVEKVPVLLSVSGWSQSQFDEEADPVRLLTTGTLQGQEDAWQIDYTETQPDSSATHDVVVKMQKGVVTMERKGDYATSMVFEKGRRFEGSYHTPYGALDMGIFATQVKYTVDAQQTGEVNLKYQLDLQGQFAATHELRIRFCPSQKA